MFHTAWDSLFYSQNMNWSKSKCVSEFHTGREWQDDPSNIMGESGRVHYPLSFCLRLSSSSSDISFSLSSLSSSILAYGRHCDRNFNLKHMRGNPSPCCSLIGRHGIGVCGEWLNFVRRPGTIKSRLPLCNRPFPTGGGRRAGKVNV